MNRAMWHSQTGIHHAVQTVVCFSHLRWDFVYQRPQHLLSRCASQCQVLFIEEPLYEQGVEPSWRIAERDHGVVVATPSLPQSTSPTDAIAMQAALLDRLFEDYAVGDFAAWYYTPMALAFTSHLRPRITIYDCMDELSAFHGAPPELTLMERQLFQKADLVFTGGASLYEAKRKQHAHVHLFPSSIDASHFGQARHGLRGRDPRDQRDIAHPRAGFFGVLDERLDRELLSQVAELRPDWQFVMVGPVVKIRQEDLPRRSNIHYLGQKPYDELPAYIAGWDLAMIPFAQNEATRFISPTKTPEYLAAGKPVVSTPIRDVVRSYGAAGLIQVAEGAYGFANAMDAAMEQSGPAWLEQVDMLLDQNSWDKTWSRMWALMQHSKTAAADRAVPAKATASALGGQYELDVVGA